MAVDMLTKAGDSIKAEAYPKASKFSDGLVRFTISTMVGGSALFVVTHGEALQVFGDLKKQIKKLEREESKK